MALEERTLFLIDEPERLAHRVAFLTSAFPEPSRAALTFSTDHDCPEELPGFRLQGTIPGARPNRLALLSQGIVGDLVAGLNELDDIFIPTRAGWLFKGGILDVERIRSRWAEELAGLVVAAPDLNPARSKLVADLREEMRRIFQDRGEPPRKSSVADSP
jgi:hypothetical protein